MKTLFDARYREILANTRRLEARQRRILRYRLLVWCLPWLPLGFVAVVAVEQLAKGTVDSLVSGVTAALLFLCLCLVLGGADYSLKIEAGWEPPDADGWRMVRSVIFFTVVQAFIIGILLLTHCAINDDWPFRHYDSRPFPGHDGKIPRNVIIQ